MVGATDQGAVARIPVFQRRTVRRRLALTGAWTPDTHPCLTAVILRTAVGVITALPFGDRRIETSEFRLAGVARAGVTIAAARGAPLAHSSDALIRDCACITVITGGLIGLLSILAAACRGAGVEGTGVTVIAHDRVVPHAEPVVAC